ncbi:hypothetical protein BH10PSE12_BH10PSE12_14080 [soil metagenome]
MADTAKPSKSLPAKTRVQAKSVAAAKSVRQAKPAALEPAKTSEPAVLTATQALGAAQAATGGDAPAPRVKRAYNKKIAPAVTPVKPERTTVAVPKAPVAAIQPPTEPVFEAAKKPAPAPAEGKAVMTDVMASTKKFAEDTKTKFESAFSDLNVKAKAGVEKSTKAIGELSDLTKGNVEALVESGKIAAKGVETMGQEAAEYSRKNFEKATATLKSLASVKTPTEFFQLQSELMSTAFDSFAKEAAKSSEAMIKLAGEVAQPISARVSLVTEKVKSLAA